MQCPGAKWKWRRDRVRQPRLVVAHWPGNLGKPWCGGVWMLHLVLLPAFFGEVCWRRLLDSGDAVVFMRHWCLRLLRRYWPVLQ